jgi:hypothetical protein
LIPKGVTYVKKTGREECKRKSRGDQCFAYVPFITRDIDEMWPSALGIVADRKFQQCSGRKPISLVTVPLPKTCCVLNNCILSSLILAGQ